ncbi:hypothetical protein LTS18_012583 [Coniosporium uncinatum]|uniref:Uncharacterized protein n=1 Tax=Coniosporium uncinatum TaxID=93489 RepID=A0ACC3DVL3_9PEZI|nr:hypothetical protein LTS18_012583 [Coniosporium uncinatum]
MMLDVRAARVLLTWPRGARAVSISGSTNHSDATGTDNVSPRRRIAEEQNRFASSPPPIAPRSPESPTPGGNLLNLSGSATFLADDLLTGPNHTAVQVYEDEEEELADLPGDATPTADSHNRLSRSLSAAGAAQTSISSLLSSTHSDDFSDHNEENDPIIHSFGPFGANILPRLASFTTQQSPEIPRPRRRGDPLKVSDSPKRQGTSMPSSPEKLQKSLSESPIKNHVINQLAFSRLHSLPLSTIMGNLPLDLKRGQLADTADKGKSTKLELSNPDLKRLLDGILCIGEIAREGKDAAGKPLENEFYYVPEMDADSMRRDAVMGRRGGTGLRAVRKSHKQYYWKKPRH